jgi:hypothetical protein
MSRGAIERAAKIIFSQNRKSKNRENAKSQKAKSETSENLGGEKNGLRKQNRRNPFKPPGTAESWDRSTRGKVAWLGDFRLSLYISPLMRPPYSEEIEPLVARRTHQKRRCPLWAQSRTVEEP